MLQQLQRLTSKGLQLQRCFSAGLNIASAVLQRKPTGEAIGEAVSFSQSQGEAKEAIYLTPAGIYEMAQRTTVLSTNNASFQNPKAPSHPGDCSSAR